MIQTSLFARSPEEAYEYLERVLDNERKMRKLMRSQKPDEYAYWTKRIGEMDEALECLEVLKPVQE